MSLGDAGRIIEVIRDQIRRHTRSMAKVEYSFGEIVDPNTEDNTASAYLNGNSATLSEGFRIPAHLHMNAGDYGIFAVDHDRGGRWIVEALPSSLFSKIALNVNDGTIYTGDGSSPPSTPFAGGSGGDGLIWAGAEFVFAEENGADEFIWE